MKTNTKHALLFAIVAGLLAAAVLITGICSIKGDTVSAADSNVSAHYRTGLKNSEMAQKFYEVLQDMADKGQLKTGTAEYDLSEVLTEKEISEYVDAQSAKILVAFGAARDSFYMDNPDLFYVDFYKLQFNAGTQDGKYVAFISSGRADNYLDTDFSSQNAVDAAIAEYETAINAVVTDAKKECGSDVVELIKFVNKYIVDNTEYDFGAYEDAHNGNAYHNYVNTAYGALVKGKAMCGGYSRAFKAVMDRLGIPCALIQGSGYSKPAADEEAGFEAHMWNAVQVGGLWYGVDTTWNDGMNATEKYLLVGDEIMSIAHYEDPIISSSGYELNYPALRPFDYGVDEDASGFVFKDEGYLLKDANAADTEENRIQFGYAVDTDPEADGRMALSLGIQYNGKDHKQLADEGKYLSVRFIYEEGKDAVPFSNWQNIWAFEQYEGMEGGIPVYQGYTLQQFNWSVYKVQFAIIDLEPTADNIIMLGYYNEKATDHILAMSAVYGNDAYGSFIPAPSVIRRTPDNNGWSSIIEPMDVTLVYSEKLEKVDERLDIGIKIISQHADIEDYAYVEDVKFDGDKTITFRFYPSESFTHSQEAYSLTPVNLQGVNSKKQPGSTSFGYKRKTVVCPKVFNDGRMYFKVYGEPMFLGAENLAESDFKDQNGQPVAGNQRSQLMLVVNKPTVKETEKMEELLTEDMGLEKEDVKASETYQIDLMMCNRIQNIGKGSYMQVGFGFPKGYGPDDAGVTFIVYHYTRNADGTIDTVEEIPCVVTEYGIVATIKSFSPFMICAVDSSKVAQKKNIYASVNGFGGTINNMDIREVGADGVEYDITADEGYNVNRVTLNGEDVTAKVESGKLKFAAAELADGSNVLEVTFIAKRVEENYKDKGIVIAEPTFVITSEYIEKELGIDKSEEPTKPTEPSDTDKEPGEAPKKTNVVGIVVGVVVGVVVVAGGAVLAVFLIKKKKNGAAANEENQQDNE